MTSAKDALISLSDYVVERTWARLQGLTDDEYAWTPVEDCWTAGADATGAFRVEGTLPAPEPAPFTTLAWRMHHLMGCYSDDRNARWLELEPSGDPLADANAQPVDAASALALLERCQATWRRYLSEVTEETLAVPLGEKAGPYADSTGAEFVLHQLDEQIHHGAELALLRDLYELTVASPRDKAVLALMRGDRAAAAQADVVKREHPKLLTDAALRGRWEGVDLLVELGFDVGNPGGRTALHQAAGSGRLDIVRTLLDHGADATAVDPDFQKTPLGWAEHFGHAAVADTLRAGVG